VENPPSGSDSVTAVPGSAGEHALQERYGTTARARGFYDHQVLDRLNERMQAFVARMEMVFIATADAAGEADCSFRAGPPGFVRVLDERTLLYPEYRGNGVMASLGNITENGHIGLMFLDLCGDAIGLHVNGRARIVDDDALLEHPDLPDGVLDGLVADGGRRPERWVGVDVLEAYIHCSKHIPVLVKREDVRQAWGTDDAVRKGGDYFRVAHVPRPRSVDGSAQPVPVPDRGRPDG
jgi:predicted pyridoxine 5'-phosphate oxidase superfamily flavin-nucleotide-binding protein